MTTAPYSPSPNGGYVSNELLALRLEHLNSTVDAMGTNVMQELRLLRTEAVRRDVYEEQRRGDQVEIKNLRDQLAQRVDKADLAAHASELATVKEDLKEAKQKKWAVWLALVGVALALGKDLLQTMIQA